MVTPELVIVDWDGPEDPHSPHNWSPFRKWFTMSSVGLMCFVSPFASTLIAPAAQTIAEDPDFNIKNSTITDLLVSIFILGYAFGPLVASPLSELYGRNIVMQISMAIFFVFNVACAVAKSPLQMLVFRFMAGMCVGGAAPLTVGGGVLADLFLPYERGLAMSVFSLTALMYVVGPVAGGFIVQNAPWRWCLWLLAIVSGITLLLSPFILAETYHPTLLQQKAEQVRKETGNSHVTTQYELSNGHKKATQVIMENLTRPFVLLFTNAACFFIGLYMAICYGYLYIMYATYADIFADRYHESLGISGLNYLAPGFGNIFGCFVCAFTMDRIYLYLSNRNGGVAIPEYRVPVMLGASFFMPIGLLIYGWTAEKTLLWFWPDFGAPAASLVTFLTMNTYIVDAFKVLNHQYAASALAATTVARSVAGALFPLFARALFSLICSTCILMQIIMAAAMFGSRLGLGVRYFP
ncbi:MFS general substrate transporter [Ramaria rubella]|nr:MFS general substrate transporter [Ramaria rubella]